MAFENISEQHVIETPATVMRAFKKKLIPNEAYLLSDNTIYKIRTVTEME